MANTEDVTYVTQITDLKSKLDDIWQPAHSALSFVMRNSLYSLFYANSYAIQPRTILLFDEEEIDSIRQKLPAEARNSFDYLLKQHLGITGDTNWPARVHYCDTVVFLSELVSNQKWAKPCILEYIDLLHGKIKDKKQTRDNISATMGVTSLVLGLISSATTLYGYLSPAAPAAIRYIGVSLMIFFALMTSVLRIVSIVNRYYAQERQAELSNIVESKSCVLNCAGELLSKASLPKAAKDAPSVQVKKQVSTTSTAIQPQILTSPKNGLQIKANHCDPSVTSGPFLGDNNTVSSLMPSESKIPPSGVDGCKAFSCNNTVRRLNNSNNDLTSLQEEAPVVDQGC